MDPVENQYGVEHVHINIRGLRIFRTDGKWLIEYRREPRTLCIWDHWWWYNDGTYVDYSDALARVEYLRETGYVTKTQFMKVKTFNID
jgi:hypothetical protein